MPVTHFTVRWPDGDVESCYSPSTIIKDYFQVGETYSLTEFVELCRMGLQAGSDRVKMLYGGTGCSRAMAQLATIEAKAKRHATTDAPVRIEGFATR